MPKTARTIKKTKRSTKKTESSLRTGDKAPDFLLTNDGEEPVKLSD